ncbi:hypothetical protein E3N88_35719 [Mikania micrantha]|uniref:Uncharacterized protein n=1 Tax=Mikania micrantha TaxID=192012 RepID=A0A5N6M1Q7_9ASTR|nr:hypothetical protein E3N88_35719 [Mikania micrantha]
MDDNNRDANRNPGKRPAVDDLTEESRRRIDSIVAQVDAEMERRAQMLARERYWGWLPNLLRDWSILAMELPQMLQDLMNDDASSLQDLWIACSQQK